MPDIRTVEPANLHVVATDLRFPEGPVAMADGSVVLTEIAAGRITKVAPDGTKTVVSECGGGPNGAAVGPDGALYVTNNGGCFDWREASGFTLPGRWPSATYAGHGSLQRIELDTGEVTVLFEACGANPLRAPNDLVFDADGGIWFTDHGVRAGRASDLTGLYWVSPDRSEIREVVFPLDAPNGVGLSPDGNRVYAAETRTGRVWGWDVVGPGQVGGDNPLGPGHGALVGDPGGFRLFDSLAVDGDGWLCVATLGAATGITSFSPDGADVDYVPLADPLVTNICFAPATSGSGGTAYVTLSGTGQLVSFDWHRQPGRLHFGG